MGLKTIAEYVENEEVLEIIREIGIDYAQGYGIAEPKPIETSL
jgi:EAL domain-containing protein (putative c-di-GMP-specific phosphodiesterase class I)